MTQPVDRITELRVRGMRCVADLRLDLGGLRMLIGENGTGKSTILEAVALAAEVPGSIRYCSDVLRAGHGAGRMLLRTGADSLGFGVSVEGAGPRLDYDVEFAFDGEAPFVRLETLSIGGTPGRRTLRRETTRAVVSEDPSGDAGEVPIDGSVLALTAFGVSAPPSFRRMIEALTRIRIHVPFDVQPVWVARRRGVPPPIRGTFDLDAFRGLTIGGGQFGNCVSALRNDPRFGRERWDRFLDDVRLGIGYDLLDITVPTVARSAGEVVFRFSPFPGDVPIDALSDGQVSYVAHAVVAATEEDASLVAIDEPESHLQPGVVVRVVWMYERLAESCPVLIATQSDVAMDAVSDAAGVIRLCELGADRGTRVLAPDAAKLASWAETYRGIGAMRQDGIERLVFPEGGPRVPESA